MSSAGEDERHLVVVGKLKSSERNRRCGELEVSLEWMDGGDAPKHSRLGDLVYALTRCKKKGGLCEAIIGFVNYTTQPLR